MVDSGRGWVGSAVEVAGTCELGGLRSFGGFGTVNIADSMDGFKGIEWNSVIFEDRPHLNDILVEAAAAHIGMDAPNAVNEGTAGNDRIGIIVEVAQDAEFLATDFGGAFAGEFDLHAIGVDGGSLKIERCLAGTGIFGDLFIAGSFGATEDGLDAGDQFGEGERLGDVIVAAHIETADAVGLAVLAGEEDDGDLDIFGLEAIDEGETGLIGQVDIEQHQVGEVAFEIFGDIGGAVMHLGEHPGGFELIGDELGQFGIVLDDQDKGFWFSHKYYFTDN